MYPNMFTSSLSHKHTFDFSKAQPNEAKLFYKMPLASFIRIINSNMHFNSAHHIYPRQNNRSAPIKKIK